MSPTPPARAHGPVRLLHLSDPHFGTEVPAVAEALLALAHEWAPTDIVVSGDMTQRATQRQFAAAAAWLARLPPAPLHILPGNHDLPWWPLWERALRPCARVMALPGGWRGGVLSRPGLTLVGVDTTRWWRHQLGTLSTRQIERVGQALRQAPRDDWRIVMTHHPLSVRHARDAADRPWGHAHALAHWQDCGVDTLLSGHLHEPAWWHTPRGALMAQAGTAV